MVAGLAILAALLSGVTETAVSGGGADRDSQQVVTVSAEEYPVYDQVVRSKFLTTGTTLVLIERMTTTLMVPDPPTPASLALFDQQGFFDARLSPDLVRGFVLANTQSARLGSLFAFDVPYRFISGEGEPESEVRGPDWVPRPHAVRFVQEAQTIDRLAFSRVGFSVGQDQALVYVANDRPDGSGAGFLVWLQAREGAWDIIDTEIVWTARSEPRPVERP